MARKSDPRQLIIWFFVGVKFLLHLFTNTRYSFHRDEYLYLMEGLHLDWGYFEVPPFTPFIGGILMEMGGSLWLVRLVPALVGCLMVWLVGRLTRSLGGGIWAVALACLGMTVSFIFLRVNSLFQPVSFNQLFWLLSAYWLVRIAQNEKPWHWYALGVTVGIGLLNKYSIAFYLVALAIGFLLSPHRKSLKSWHPWIAIGLALLLFLPNLLWQQSHHWPLWAHMQDLHATQLVNVSVGQFIGDQFLFHFGVSLIWLAGLAGVFLIPSLKPYRFVGIAFIIVISLLIYLSGKSYYSMGAYPVLFVMGGLALAHWLPKVVKWILVVLIVLPIIPLSPYALYLLSHEKMEKYAAEVNEKYGLDGPLIWEDGEVHALPQDYADMIGWEEMVEKVGRFYHSLPEEEQHSLLLWGGNYGHAGALNYFREKYQLPVAYSFNSSFLIWNPDTISFDRMLLVDDRFSLESDWFENVVLIDSIENPYARDPGYIFYRTQPKVDVEEVYRELVEETKKEFGF